MFKKLLLVSLVCLGILGCKGKTAFAEVNLSNYLKKLTTINQGVIFSLADSSFDYSASVTLVSLFDKKINLDLGYSPKVEALGLASFKLIEVKDIITFPILDKAVIEPFIYFGTKRLKNLKELGEADYGVGVKIISLKW